MLKRFTTLIIAAAFVFIACEQNMPNQAADEPGQIELLASVDARTFSYPMFGSKKIAFWKDYYMGGNIKMDDGSTFHVNSGAVTPPSSIAWGDDFYITWLVEMVNGELVFTFGPHGTTFSPSAEIWLDYSVLGTDNVTLWYIEDDGTRTEQKPADMQGQRLKLYVDHFSRYAIGTEY